MANCSCSTESWRVIYSAPDYAVSDQGRVMRIAAQRMARIGGIIKPRNGWYGYKNVSLLVDGAHKCFSVHRLVCEAFHGAPPTRRHQAAHSNGDPSDNRASNLRWATPKENIADRVAHGTDFSGARNPRVKLTEDDVHAIRRTPRTYGVSAMLAKRYGVTGTTIDNIQLGKVWKSLPWEDGVSPQPSLKKAAQGGRW